MANFITRHCEQALAFVAKQSEAAVSLVIHFAHPHCEQFDTIAWQSSIPAPSLQDLPLGLM